MIRKIPKKITLILNETETIFLLDISSSIVLRETDEGEAAEMDNRLYQHLTEGKGRNRRVSTIGVQTIPILTKTRNTEPIQYTFRDNSTFASNWEMYDTYNKSRVEELTCLKQDDHKLIEDVSPEELRKTQEIKELEKLTQNKKYFDAVLVIERLLANNCYNDEQKKFKGLDGEQETIRYDYKLDLLWTFANADTKNRCVTGISFNSFTEDILAVGYGKYYFTERRKTGVIMIWNIKNPKQPEREYYFKYSVTCLAFSKRDPNLLAVGFYNGDVLIMDISVTDFKSVGEDSSTSFKPAWDILWFEQNQEECLLVCFGDGRVCIYSQNGGQLHSVQIMRIEKIEGRLKGLNGLRLFEGNHVASTRYASAISLTMHQANPSRYLVGTNEGVIHKCIASYCTQHIDMFKAHEGSVHTIKFSPFVNKVYATCGDDFQECLWIEGINEPLIVSRYCMEPVLDIEWSPSHSTIMASLRGMDIFLWDLQRKIYSPQSQTMSPTNSRNTVCKFTASGRCLVVGDIDGNVHIFSVSGLPIPAFFQESAFFRSVKNLLLTNTEMVRKLEKLGVFQ